MSISFHRRRFLAGAASAATCACDGARRPKLRASLAAAPNPDANGVWIWLRACLDALNKSGLAFNLSVNGALGREEDRTEMTGLDLIQINDSSISEVTALSDIYVTAQLPFLIDDLEQFDRLFTNKDFLAQINADLRKAGLVLIDAAFLGGMSGIFTAQRPVRRLEDMQGLRLRAMDSRDLVLIEAFGAAGVQVAWEETPQALQTGIASGYLNPPLAPVLFGHGAYLRYFTDLRIAPAHRLIMASRDWHDRLDRADRAAADAAFAAGRKANRDWSKTRFESDIATLKAYGIKIISMPDEAREAFKTQARAAYGAYAEPAIIEKALVFVKGAAS